ncbi:MAG: ASKHA domain-containing protein [Clostridia bacterium]|nr:ASKHA domain-containing protein [Clostridia bacterium]
MGTLILPGGTGFPLCAEDAGTALTDLLLRSGATFSLPCGGAGKCGKCAVRVTGNGLEIPEADANGRVLACRCIVRDPAEDIVLSEAAFLGLCPEKPSDTQLVPDESLGLAVDIGTTTVLLSVWELSGEPRRLGEARFFNPQSAFGQDVISRVAAARRGKAAELRTVLSDALRTETVRLLESLGREGFPVQVTVAANTAMLCLALGFDVKGLSRAPFTVPDRFGKTYPLSLLFPGAEGTLTVPPVIGPFLGADTVAALTASDFSGKEPPALFLDLGTNGEMALSDGTRLLCCSAAAGPALEGAGISCGGLYGPGAVTDAAVQGEEIRLTVCGDRPADRLCASGLIACADALVSLGKVAPNGTIADADERKTGVPLGKTGLRLTQEDIRALQLAKAAMRAGLSALMRRLPEDAVPALYLTGGIPATASAKRIGLLPPECAVQRVADALRGAELLLTEPDTLARMMEIADRAEVLELNREPVFEEDLMRFMRFGE